MTVEQLRCILTAFEQDGYGPCQVVYQEHGKEVVFNLLLAVTSQDEQLGRQVILLCDGDALDIATGPPVARSA